MHEGGPRPNKRPEWAQERDKQWEKIKARARAEAETALKAEKGSTPESKTVAEGEQVFPIAEYERALQQGLQEAERQAERMKNPIPAGPMVQLSASAQNREADLRFSRMHEEDAKGAVKKPVDPFEPEPTTFAWTPDGGETTHEPLYYTSDAHAALKNPSIGRAVKHAILALSAFVASFFAAPTPLQNPHTAGHAPANIAGPSVAGAGSSFSSSPELISGPTLVREGSLSERLAEVAKTPQINLRPALKNSSGTEVAGYMLRDLVRDLGASRDAQKRAESLPRAYLLHGRHLQDAIGIPNGKHTSTSIPDSVKVLMLDTLFGKDEVRDGMLARVQQLKLSPEDKALLQKAIEQAYNASRAIS